MYFILGFCYAGFTDLQISFQVVFSGVIYEVQLLYYFSILLQTQNLNFAICSECGRTLPLWIRTNDPRSLRVWCIKKNRKSLSSLDPSNLGSVILLQIIQENCTLY